MSITLKVRIKHNLRILMAQEGIKTIQSLAEESDLHANTLYKLDNGESTKLQLESVCKLLWVFDCKFEDLFQFEVESSEPESSDDLSDDLQAEIKEARCKWQAKSEPLWQ